MSVLSVCLLETTVYVLVKVGVSPCKGSSQAVFFCCCKDENPNVLHTNWDWFRYYIVNMCLASNDNINKRITLHECFNFERQSWHEPGNLEVKNVSPYSLSTSYRRESHLGNTFFSIRWIYIYLTWRENNISQSRAFDSIYILPASFPLLVVPHAVITLETNRCYLEALCLYKIHFFWVARALKKVNPASGMVKWCNDTTWSLP